MNTVPENKDWARGDALGLDLPAHAAALAEGGEAYLTRAFQAAGALAADNRVVRIIELAECPGGSTGRKLLLSVAYATPGLPERLFVKFSRDFDDPVRDRGRDQMELEVRFALMSRAPGFPIAVPACLYADYHHASGTGVLITERIGFGEDGIEPHYEKCLDYEMPEPLEHYQALLTALGRLAGAHRAGRLPPYVATEFPVELDRLIAADPIRHDADKLQGRVARYADFAAEFPHLLPDNIRAPGFIARLNQDVVRFKAEEAAIKRYLHSNPDLIALCHWNTNVDNAWFWRGEGGRLQCGLLDWGRVGQMNVALALLGGLSAAEPEMWDSHLDDLLALFAREYAQAGGPGLDVQTLKLNFCLFVAVMTLAWMIDAPALIRARMPDLAEAKDRHDERFKTNETARTQLHMLTNFLNLWERQDFGALLGKVAT